MASRGRSFHTYTGSLKWARWHFSEKKKIGLVTHFAIYLGGQQYLGALAHGCTAIHAAELLRRVGEEMIGAISFAAALDLRLIRKTGHSPQ